MSAHVQTGEYEWEPIRGLPAELPEGERILWQGAPSWRSLARHAFHTRKLALYFGVLIAWRVVSAAANGERFADAALPVAAFTGLALAALGLLSVMAWLHARATVYTLTNRRVVIRFGVALNLAVNAPFATLRGAALKPYRDGTGDIALAIEGAERIGYVMLWPHVRPWKLGSGVQPALRSVPDADAVAERLARAVAAAAERGVIQPAEADVEGAPALPVALAS